MSPISSAQYTMNGFALASHAFTWRACSSGFTPFACHACNCAFASLIGLLFAIVRLNVILSEAKDLGLLRVFSCVSLTHLHDLGPWTKQFHRPMHYLLPRFIVIQLQIHRWMFLDICRQLAQSFTIFRSHAFWITYQPTERHRALSP